MFFNSIPGGGEVMMAEVKATGTVFETSVPRALFAIRRTGPPHANGPSLTWTVSRDGQRIVGVQPADVVPEGTDPIEVVLNWTAALKK